MAMSPREKKEFVGGLIKATAVPLAVGVVLVLVLLYESSPPFLVAALEWTRRVIH